MTSRIRLADAMPTTGMGAPPVQVLGTAVLLQGPALRELAHLALLGARERSRRDGASISSELQDVLRTLASASTMSQPRHGDVAEEAISAESVVLEVIDIKEAARMLDLGVRQAQRIAPSIGGRRCPGGAWEFDRGVVATYVAERKAS